MHTFQSNGGFTGLSALTNRIERKGHTLGYNVTRDHSSLSDSQYVYWGRETDTDEPLWVEFRISGHSLPAKYQDSEIPETTVKIDLRDSENFDLIVAIAVKFLGTDAGVESAALARKHQTNLKVSQTRKRNKFKALTSSLIAKGINPSLAFRFATRKCGI